MTAVVSLDSRRWDLADLDLALRDSLVALIEDGGVLCLKGLPRLADEPQYRALLDPRWADPGHKNISFDPVRQRLNGATGDAGRQETMTHLLGAYQAQALQLVRAIAPHYGSSLRLAPASLRLLQVQGRASSWRKDDSRLHIDAFPSRPNRGERILRVFHNIHPGQVPRVWRVGEPFAGVARRFAAQLPPYSRLKARALYLLKATKTLRSEYDHVMLALHDAMKADLSYQAMCPQQTLAFGAGSVWVCFSDQTSHAVMSGQFMLEQTLHLPVDAMQQPARSPLRVLEALYQRPLV
jgi:hypothetical protein